MSDYKTLRQHVVDWLDDNYHFGDTEALISSDDMSFMDNGVLDSLGFVQLILFLENTFRIELDRKDISERISMAWPKSSPMSRHTKIIKASSHER